MRALRLAALLCVSLALAACGKQQAANELASRSAPPGTALTPRPSAPAGSANSGQHKAAGQTAVGPSLLNRTNEDGSETVEDTTGDSGTHNPLLAAVASTVAAATPAAAAQALAAPTLWQEGVNYTRVVPAQPTSVAAGQVEVLEFFWYACPHCYAIDPLIESWKKTKPAYISFSRVPVTWSEGHRSLARLFYTLENLGKLEQLHSDVFKEIHVNGNPLVGANPNDAAEAERVQAAFVKSFGISEDAFKKAYDSFAVETALQRADQLVQRYRIDGVPTFVINGKYLADVRTAGSPERLITLVGDLAAQEHRH
ncbi:MAG: thiol:disulfide interchange protein DsbA/DsbL [Steroidobacteraceae bacterium]